MLMAMVVGMEVSMRVAGMGIIKYMVMIGMAEMSTTVLGIMVVR
jgi:hypothetical protein